MNTTFGKRARAGLRAAVPAGVLSGIPSTVHALATKGDPLEASIAAGSILLPNEQRKSRLVIAAVPVHVGLSAVWAIVLAAALPLRKPVGEGALAGFAIAVIDLGVIGRRYTRIRALRPLPQIADHVIFGVVTAIALSRASEART